MYSFCRQQHMQLIVSVTGWLGGSVGIIGNGSLINQYPRNYNRSEVENLRVGRPTLWWKDGAKYSRQ